MAAVTFDNRLMRFTLERFLADMPASKDEENLTLFLFSLLHKPSSENTPESLQERVRLLTQLVTPDTYSAFSGEDRERWIENARRVINNWITQPKDLNRESSPDEEKRWIEGCQATLKGLAPNLAPQIAAEAEAADAARREALMATVGGRLREQIIHSAAFYRISPDESETRLAHQPGGTYLFRFYRKTSEGFYFNIEEDHPLWIALDMKCGHSQQLITHALSFDSSGIRTLGYQNSFEQKIYTSINELLMDKVGTWGIPYAEAVLTPGSHRQRIVNSPAFFNFNREQSAKHLMGKPPGTYLLRPSSMEGELVLDFIGADRMRRCFLFVFAGHRLSVSLDCTELQFPLYLNLDDLLAGWNLTTPLRPI